MTKMTTLSPKAQAVLNATFPVYDDETLYVATEEQHASMIAAAALRAVVDQVLPEQIADRDLGHSWEHIAMVGDRMGIRHQFLTIANELKNYNKDFPKPHNMPYNTFICTKLMELEDQIMKEFNKWFNEDLYGKFSCRSEWFYGDCEVENEKIRKDLLYNWVRSAYVSGYELGITPDELAQGLAKTP